MIDALTAFLDRGGPVLWIIGGLSVLTLALILWKLMQLARLRIWSRGAGSDFAALDTLTGLRGRLARQALAIRSDGAFSDGDARDEVTRIARAGLAEARHGLRALELISTIAPLLGLLGTVLGMIAAFRTLQETGAQADPAALAGGIWEALLTTAAGMAVAIPAGVALSWFEGLTDRLQADLEDIATLIFTRRAQGAS